MGTRRRRRGRRAGGAAGIVGLLWLLALALPAGGSARETRPVLDGRYELTVGFVNEPAFEGEPNGLYLRVTSVPPLDEVVVPVVTAGALDVTPTPAPGSGLTAEVAYGPAVAALTLAPVAQSGVFQALFVPTQPGDYVFRIVGNLGDEPIFEEFRTGEGGIPPVVGVDGLQFPDKIPVNQGLLDALAERETETERARTLAVVGIALGVVGLLAGGMAVVLSRRPPPPGVRDEARDTEGRGTEDPALNATKSLQD
jgi:hypothetical protein